MKRISFVIAMVLVCAAPLRAESDPLKRAAAELAEGLSRQKNAKVAVLAIPYFDNRASDAPFMISEKITTYLVKDKRLAVLERNHIVQMLEELRLSETGALDSKTAKKIGQALGAEIIVTGTLIDLDEGQTELNVRGLLADSGKIVAASRASLDRIWNNRKVVSW